MKAVLLEAARMMVVACAIVAVVVAVGNRLDAQDRAKAFVYQDSSGSLVYPTDPLGNRIPDYSHCGYRSGNAPSPDVQAMVRVVEAIEGDASEKIQAAIDFVSSLPLSAEGFRGAVLLTPGDFRVSRQLSIRASGVVLRGTPQTTFSASGADRRALIRIHGDGHPQLGDEVAIVDDICTRGRNSIRGAIGGLERWDGGCHSASQHSRVDRIDWYESISDGR